MIFSRNDECYYHRLGRDLRDPESVTVIVEVTLVFDVEVTVGGPGSRATVTPSLTATPTPRPRRPVGVTTATDLVTVTVEPGQETGVVVSAVAGVLVVVTVSRGETVPVGPGVGATRAGVVTVRTVTGAGTVEGGQVRATGSRVEVTGGRVTTTGRGRGVDLPSPLSTLGEKVGGSRGSQTGQV